MSRVRRCRARMCLNLTFFPYRILSAWVSINVDAPSGDGLPVGSTNSFYVGRPSCQYFAIGLGARGFVRDLVDHTSSLVGLLIACCQCIDMEFLGFLGQLHLQFTLFHHCELFESYAISALSRKVISNQVAVSIQLHCDWVSGDPSKMSSVLD